MGKQFQYRLINALGLGLLIALGLGSKAYTGWGQTWVHNYSGDIGYEVFWIWLIGFFRPKASVTLIAILVFLITAVIELTQLIPFPHTWKSNLLWRLFLGSQFSLLDFPHYALGSLLGGLSLITLQQRFCLTGQSLKGMVNGE